MEEVIIETDEGYSVEELRGWFSAPGIEDIPITEVEIEEEY